MSSLLYSVTLYSLLPPVSLDPPHRSMCMRRLAVTRSIHLPGSWCNRNWPSQTARTDVLQSAFVPGSRLNSTGKPPSLEDRTCLCHILAHPWGPGGITATTQLPAHRRGPLHLLKPDVPSVQQLVDELLLEIALRCRVCRGIVHPIACERNESRRRPSPSTH
jgi:hypothetical protein